MTVPVFNEYEECDCGNSNEPFLYISDLECHEFRKDITCLSCELNSCEGDVAREALILHWKKFKERKVGTLVPLPVGEYDMAPQWKMTRDRRVIKIDDEERLHVIYNTELYIPLSEQQDYVDTLAPNLGFETFRMTLAYAAIHDWEVHNVMFKEWEMFGELRRGEHVYMNQPGGFVVRGKEDWVYRLNKCLPGMKQAQRCFYETVKTFLFSNGFQWSMQDPALFVKNDALGTVVLGLYVDDCVIYAENSQCMNATKDLLRTKFKIKDLGEIRKWFNIDIQRVRETKHFYLSDSTRIENILREANMMNCRENPTPIDENTCLTHSMSPQSEEESQNVPAKKYRSFVGKLVFMARTFRPDLAYVAGELSRFTGYPGIGHWEAAKDVMRYLKGTKEMGVHVGGLSWTKTSILSGYSFGMNSKNHSVSRTSSIFYCGDGLLTWTTEYYKKAVNSNVSLKAVKDADATIEKLYSLFKSFNPMEPPRIELATNFDCGDIMLEGRDYCVIRPCMNGYVNLAEGLVAQIDEEAFGGFILGLSLPHLQVSRYSS